MNTCGKANINTRYTCVKPSSQSEKRPKTKYQSQVNDTVQYQLVSARQNCFDGITHQSTYYLQSAVTMTTTTATTPENNSNIRPVQMAMQHKTLLYKS